MDAAQENAIAEMLEVLGENLTSNAEALLARFGLPHFLTSLVLLEAMRTDIEKRPPTKELALAMLFLGGKSLGLTLDADELYARITTAPNSPPKPH